MAFGGRLISRVRILLQLEPRDLVPVHLVGPVGETQQARGRIGLRQAEIIRRAAAAMGRVVRAYAGALRKALELVGANLAILGMASAW